MTEVRFLTQVPVELLRYGLYVAELDRPWAEVPVMFQGFTIHSAEELKVLREHCRFVYVEEVRSRQDVFDDLKSELDRAVIPEPRPEGKAQAGQTDLSVVLGNVRHPDKRLFEPRIKAAAASRGNAQAFLERVCEDVRVGRAFNSQQARRVVADMATQVSSNASAAMWLTSLKQKDEYSSAHAVNVCVLALAFGMYLGLRGAQLQNIGMGALLHDVGIVTQPPELLTKPGPLTAEELAIVRRHPEEGAAIVARSETLPTEVYDIIRMHHERLDGKGFPHGLKGEEFPRHARLVALVNLYDSLTTDRPYRPGRPADEVLQDLYNGRGQTYGAELVQAFIHCIGIFPIGSLVELDNGALGVVVGSSPESRLRPTVLLVRTPAGDYYEKRLLLNLAAEPDAHGPSARFIRRVVNPARYDIDVASIVAFEFGVLL
jgi:HD-GYP domain-containing protein (c-di-GMP phosphodiesterase class II)